MGGDVGNGVEAVTWELRMFKVICLVARSSEQSYRRNSRLDFRDCRYELLRDSNSFMAFAWMANWNALVRSTMA